MEIKFMPQAEDDLAFWKATGNKRMMKRITKLLDDILQHPFTGIGKPEPLKGELHGISGGDCCFFPLLFFSKQFLPALGQHLLVGIVDGGRQRNQLHLVLHLAEVVGKRIAAWRENIDL